MVHIRPSLTFKHLAHRDTKVCRPKQNKLATCVVPSVLHVHLSYRLPRTFVSCPKRWKSLGSLLPIGLATGYGCTAGTMCTIHPSLHLAPGYLHLFESLKKGLAGERFAGDPDLKQTVSWTDRNADICNVGIQTSVSRWDKCLNANGDYVEVCCVPSATRVPYVRRRQNKNLRHESVWPPLLTYCVLKQFVKLFFFFIGAVSGFSTLV